MIETSLIHKSATFKDVSCEINRSVIGSNVTIGTKVKIQNSVVLNDVVIQDYEHVIDCLRVPNQVQESEEESRSSNKQKNQSASKWIFVCSMSSPNILFGVESVASENFSGLSEGEKQSLRHLLVPLLSPKPKKNSLRKIKSAC